MAWSFRFTGKQAAVLRSLQAQQIETKAAVAFLAVQPLLVSLVALSSDSGLLDVRAAQSDAGELTVSIGQVGNYVE